MTAFDALVRHQRGLVRTDQALELGLTRHAVAARVQRGEWRRLLRGIYATPSADLPEATLLRRAALLLAGSDATLSHRSALAEHGLLVDEGGRVHVSVVATGTLPSPAGVVVHRRTADTPLMWRRGVPLISVETAVLQTFAARDDDRRAVVCAAIAGRHTTVARLRLAALRNPVRDVRAFRELLALVELGCHSPIEIDYLLLVERAFGLPAGERQARLHRSGRDALADVYYRGARVAIELDGAEHHSTDSARRADIRRDAELATQGIVTLRFTGRQVRDEPEWVAGCVLDAISVRMQQLRLAPVETDKTTVATRSSA